MSFGKYTNSFFIIKRFSTKISLKTCGVSDLTNFMRVNVSFSGLILYFRKEIEMY